MEEEIQGKYLGYLDSIKNLLDDIKAGDVQGIPEQKLAELNNLYQQAQDQFTQGIGAYQPYVDTGAETMAQGVGALGQAQDIFGQAGQAYAGIGKAPTMEELQAYMNPYQQAIQDEINRTYNIARTKAAAGAVGAGAFGGDREGVQRALMTEDEARARSRSMADAFNYATQQKYARDLASAQGLGATASGIGSLGSQYGAFGAGQAGLGFDVQKAGLIDVGTMLDFGNLQQQQLQKQYDVDYANQMAKYQQPFTELGFLGSAFGYAPAIPQVASAGGGGSLSPLQQTLGYGIAGLGALSGLSGLKGLF
jgi:hypothetical protein